jgi:eukaryotic-like serine/threonine-protein kinase
MDIDHQLLFGALALQTGLIDSQQFTETYKQWGGRPESSLRDLLVQLDLLSSSDVSHLDYLLQRLLDKHHGDPRATLSSLSSVIKQALAAFEEIDPKGTAAGVVSPTGVTAEATPDDFTLTEPRYELVKLYGSGGIGRIWRAQDRQFDREVALKELRREQADDPKIAARFLREARLTGQLEHPGVVPVYELGFRPVTNQPYYTMRLVQGRTLAESVHAYHTRCAEGRADPMEFVSLLNAFAAVCNTVAYAHSRGIVHRDLKGENVILGDFGEVIVLDWGVAKFIGKPDDAGDSIQDPMDEKRDPTLTYQGEIIGTPAYMSPEQAEGRQDQIDERTDIYGLGSMLYTILTGRSPFEGSSIFDVLRKAVVGDPTPPRNLCPDAPAALEEACLKAMAREPAKRYASATELAQEVQRWQEVQRRQAEEELRASEEKYRFLADLIPGIVWTAQPDGWIDFANQFWLSFTGLTMQQTEGSGWAVAVHPHDLEHLTKVWGDALQTGEPVEVEYRVKRAADGEYRWFLAQGRPVRDVEGRIFKWFGLLTEIEDQKRGEKALKREYSLVRLLHEVTVAAYEAATVDEAMQVAVDRICAYTGWPVGHVYLVDERNPQELTPTSIWHLDRADFQTFVRVTEETRLAVGVGLPGRVLASKRPYWVMDVTQDANFPRAKLAANLGVKGAFGFPVSTARGVAAVLEFFTSDPSEPDEALLRSMEQIGLQLGQVFDRKRADAELQQVRSQLSGERH